MTNMGNDRMLGGMGMQMGGRVVLVNKLVPDKVNPDILFTLFGVYGDVVKVKILYNKRDTALLQYQNHQQCQYAVEHLNHCNLFGQQIVVQHARMPEVNVPRDFNADEIQLTKDYSNSPLHRFRRKNFINPKNVNSPSQVLHVANLYDGATEQELQALFRSQQQSEPIVEFFKSSRKMAYVCMASISDAIHALINLHGCKELGGYPLRVSFSHKSPTSIQPSAGPITEGIMGGQMSDGIIA